MILNIFTIYYLWNDSFEYSVINDINISRQFWRHNNEHAFILGQWLNILYMVRLCRLPLSQPWLLVHGLHRDWWCCKGAVLISQGNRSQLQSTNDLFNAWHSQAGLKEKLSALLMFMRYGLKSLTGSTMILKTECHRETRQTSCLITHYDSVIRLKWAVAMLVHIVEPSYRILQ